MENNKIGNIETVKSSETFGIKSENSPFAEAFHFENFYDDSLVKKFIKSTERLIRQSDEYKTYIAQLRSTIDALNHDNILSNITNGDVELEFHHYPFNLYEIVEIVMIDNMINKVKFTTFSVAKKVMELHYKHLIGLVPLTAMNHKLAHNDALFISTKQIFGDWESFMKIYKSSISYDKKQFIENIKYKTENGAASDFRRLF